MIVFPAVDIKDGRCVRLRKGRPETAKQYFEEPWRAAECWEKSGASWLHVVDLDGALTQSEENSMAVRTLLSSTRLNVQLGGGIRNDAAIESAIAAGAKRVVIGTRAVEDPEWTISQCLSRPGKIVIALDAIEGLISVRGWKESTDCEVVEMAAVLEAGRPAAFLYTDVARDGMLSHPNFEGVANLAKSTEIPVIASGGVSCLEDIEELGRCGADALITGKALYEEKFRLEDALDIAARFDSKLK